LLVPVKTTGYARNGLLSSKLHDDGSEEVIFSYFDAVHELSAQSFLNIIINFVETAAILRSKLQLLTRLKELQHSMSPANVHGSIPVISKQSTFNLIPFDEAEIANVASGGNAAEK
jgi:hypothetical protein